jgi:hypothetical protein
MPPPSPKATARHSRPAFMEIDGKLYLWRDILARRKEQLRAHAAGQQPPLFELKHDQRPESERTATGRYREPTLFVLIER